jgi:hypothetical protein
MRSEPGENHYGNEICLRTVGMSKSPHAGEASGRQEWAQKY